MNWTIKGQAIIMDGERPVAVVDRPEDAKLIIDSVNECARNREQFESFTKMMRGEITVGDCVIKIGGTE
jgi:hypothetical protein